MEIEEAFRHALDGDAILFVGAGFSLGAHNLRNEDFPLSNDLARHLMNAIGETENVPLEIASEVFIERKGEVGLLEFLNQHLGVQSVDSHHRSFVRPNWRRIYTTNYDEVFETAARDEGVQTRSLILEPRIPSAERDSVDCVHLNGFLPRANARNLNSMLVLSQTAYLTNRFLESTWARLFRSDVEAARAVVFAGYSLADIDIGRLLVAIDSLKRKCAFIVKPDPGLSLTTKVNKFGALAPIGVESAAAILDQVAKTHKPATRHLTYSSFRQLGKLAVPTTPPTAKDVVDLFVKGNINEGLLVHSLADAKPSYMVRRAEMDKVAELFCGGEPVVLILSRFANGKTLLSEAIAGFLRDRFDILSSQRRALL